jgi:hypothetical protein
MGTAGFQRFESLDDVKSAIYAAHKSGSKKLQASVPGDNVIGNYVTPLTNDGHNVEQCSLGGDGRAEVTISW